ncbi:hypothetical protein [Microbacterium sp. W4I20]|uniref:hypothetical protein n=1 Tax=Microbacterium sp. W4I20 TaxID=3042262 RepID=UPI0027844393|nr:hypothetical protein [Microbacterium sp. W4I20]MDQ0728841.1 hypothetical protein [Microbacterium sp. W4I20]
MRSPRLLTTSAVLALSVALVTGCSASEPEPVEELRTPSTPAAEEQPSAEELEIRAIRDRIKELKAIPAAEFKFLDRADRLLYLGDVLRPEYDEISQRHADGEYITAYNPLKVAAVDNSAASIVHQYEYVQRALFLQRAGDGTTENFDFDAAQKAVSAYYYMSGDSLVVSNEYNAVLETMSPLTTITRIINSWTGEEFGPVTAGTDKDGNPVQYKDILVTDHNGVHEIKRFIFSTFVDWKGQDRAVWQFLAGTTPETPELLDTFM